MKRTCRNRGGNNTDEDGGYRMVKTRVLMYMYLAVEV